MSELLQVLDMEKGMTDRRPKYIEAEASLDVSPRVVSATDSTPILYITDDSTGLNVSFPNNTLINTASDGIISTSLPALAVQWKYL